MNILKALRDSMRLWISVTLLASSCGLVYAQSCVNYKLTLKNYISPYNNSDASIVLFGNDGKTVASLGVGTNTSNTISICIPAEITALRAHVWANNLGSCKTEGSYSINTLNSELVFSTQFPQMGQFSVSGPSGSTSWEFSCQQ